MSDPPAPPPPAPTPAPIDFERAAYAEPDKGHVACSVCGARISTEYWQCQGKILCAACREGAEKSIADARRGATLGKAFLVGGGAALGCGIGYAIFAGLTHIHFALITIGIGWVVGRAVHKVTRGLGSRKHQVLAVALTYCASTMGYLPGIVKALGEVSQKSDAGAVAPASTAAPADPPTPGSQPTSADEPRPEKAAPAQPPAVPGAVAIVLAIVLVTVLTLAAPFLEIAGGFSGLLGLLIIFFGLQAAWRVSRGAVAPITGPHQIAGS